MKAIIFGIGGQDGFYLKQILTRQGIEVLGISRSVGDWITGDIGNFDFVSNIIRESQPQYVFHFAANSTVRHDVLFENHHSISTGTLNVLESCFKFSKHTKVFLLFMIPLHQCCEQIQSHCSMRSHEQTIGYN